MNFLGAGPNSLNECVIFSPIISVPGYYEEDISCPVSSDMLESSARPWAAQKYTIDNIRIH